MEDKQLVKKINQLVEGQIITQEDGTESALLINKANHNHVLLFTVYDGTIYLNGTGLDEANRTIGYKGNPITLDTVRLIALHTVREYVPSGDIDSI